MDSYLVIFFEYDKTLQQISSSKVKSSDKDIVTVEYETTELAEDGRQTTVNKPYTGHVVFSGSSISCRGYLRSAEETLGENLKSIMFEEGLQKLKEIAAQRKGSGKRGASSKLKRLLEEEANDSNIKKKKTSEMRPSSEKLTTHDKQEKRTRKEDSIKPSKSNVRNSVSDLKKKEMLAFAGLIPAEVSPTKTEVSEGIPKMSTPKEKGQCTGKKQHSLAQNQTSPVVKQTPKTYTPKEKGQLTPNKQCCVAPNQKSPVVEQTPKTYTPKEKGQFTPNKQSHVVQKRKSPVVKQTPKTYTPKEKGQFTPNKQYSVAPNKKSPVVKQTPKRSASKEKGQLASKKQYSVVNNQASPVEIDNQTLKTFYPKEKRQLTPKKQLSIANIQASPVDKQTPKTVTPKEKGSLRFTPKKQCSIAQNQGSSVGKQTPKTVTPKGKGQFPRKIQYSHEAQKSPVGQETPEKVYTALETCVPSLSAGVKTSMLALLNSSLDQTEMEDLGEYGYNSNYQSPDYPFEPSVNTELGPSSESSCQYEPRVSSPFTGVIEYFDQLPRDHKDSITSFLLAFVTALRQQTDVKTDSSPHPRSHSSICEADFSSPVSRTCSAEAKSDSKKVMLITDSKCPARFSSVLVNPVALRSVEQMALFHKKPEVYLLNKVSSLLFTEEEFKQATGVMSLDSLKQAALRYLFAKQSAMGIPAIDQKDYRLTLQNKITNSRKNKANLRTKARERAQRLKKQPKKNEEESKCAETV